MAQMRGCRYLLKHNELSFCFTWFIKDGSMDGWMDARCYTYSIFQFLLFSLVCDRHAFTYDYEILSGVYLCALFFGVFFLFGAGFFLFLVLVLVLRAGLALFLGFLDTYLYFPAQLWVDTRTRGKLFSIQKGEFRKSSRLDTHLSTTINYLQPSSLTARGN
jgi:hypothetical protein